MDTTKIPAVEIGLRTDPGRDPDKQVNEDAATSVETPLGLLALVCDGMGGHAGGKEASELTVKTITELLRAAPPGSNPKTVVRHAIEEANARVWGMPTAEAGLRPGSTVVAAVFDENGAHVAHVGDSRLYLVHAGAISQVTRDHSMVQEMVDRNIIKAEDAAKHPDANKILRAIGIAKEVEVDVRAESIAYVAGDVFVLCSDGLSDLVGPPEILEIAGAQPAQQAAGQLVDLANARGGHDNITAMVVRARASVAQREGATVAKTVQLTANEVPPDRGSGPKGTVVAAPAGAQRTLQVPQRPPGLGPTKTSSSNVVDAPPPGTLPPPTPHHHSSPPPSRAAPARRAVAIGIVLALVGLALLAGLLWVSMRKVRRDVKVIDDEPREAAAVAADDDDGGPDPEITPSPPLSAPLDAATAPHHARDGGHPHAPSAAVTPMAPSPAAPDPPVCKKAREARIRGGKGPAVEALEQQCRAQGGLP